LILFNAHLEDIEFCTPPPEYADEWVVVIDTADPALDDAATVGAQTAIKVPARSLLLLEKVTA
ncbi:MAG: isoamylase, partial [Jatrophihabitantaceae bacterium]|nr:isoamylase [Jatrophihabitantaceae bacterium]